MKVTTMGQVFSPERRRTHLSVERVNGEALKKLIEKRKLSVTDLSRRSSVAFSTIYDYIKGNRLLGDSRVVNKLAKALGVDPIEIILCPGECSPVFKGILPEEKVVKSATDKPIPMYIEGQKYRIVMKGRAGSISEGIFKFVGTAKGAKREGDQRIHYMFMNTAGKWIMTLTDIDLRTDGTEITPTNEKRGKVA